MAENTSNENTANENIPAWDGCTHNCNTCGSACGEDGGERKPSFFDRMEMISEGFDAVGEEAIIQMLNDAVAEWEAEEAAEAGTEAEE